MRLAVLDNPANLIAHGMTGRNYLSLSQVTTYQTCPLRWYFQYVAQLPHEQVGASLVLGGAIHSAIEAYYQAELAGEPVPDRDRLMTVFEEAWRKNANAPIHFGKDDSAGSLNDLAGRMVSAFLESSSCDPGGTVLGIEEEIRTEYLPGVPDLLARVDLIILTDDALVIRDFKTARSRWTAAKLAEAAVQLVLYGDLALPMAQAFGDRPVRLEFVVLTKTKSPQVEVLPVEADAASLVRLRRIIERVWAAMQAGHVYPNPSALNCSSCPFQRACREWCD
ncbi:MAG TPA: PD-(D/E)XK nuclease family protein [Phycisphaerae bacterium]|nr:PD-(D/E)XK nuclease family protein [Phycisphaerae bacterium]